MVYGSILTFIHTLTHIHNNTQDKCQVIHITRSKNPIPTQYTLHNCLLESVSSAKHLGVNISSDLSWETHINRISKKANNTLGFLRRNIKIHSESLKSSAYKVLVRPQFLKLSKVELPYGSNMTSSVTEMMQSLLWRRLDQRRIDNKLSLMYKITHNLSRCYQFSPMQGTVIHKRSSHACFVKRNRTYVLIKYLFTTLNDFVHLIHPIPVQNIVTIKPPCV